MTRRAGASHLELRHTARRLFEELPSKTHKVGMRLPLAATPEKQWDAIDRKLRNQVRKADKSDLTILRGGPDLLDAFYEVFAWNMRDLGTPVYDKRFFAEVLAAFPAQTRVLCVKLRERPIAGSIVFRYRRMMEVPWASSSVCRPPAPHIAAHWEFLLAPLVLDNSDQPGAIRYRLLEYYRMPVMAYLSLDDPRALSRGELLRLGLVTAPGDDAHLPYSDRHVSDFEQRFCYDRYWSTEPEGPTTRFMCCGHALVVIGRHDEALFTDAETGVLGQFRHQHFLLFLIAHFHKAALLMFSDRLVVALNQLNIRTPSRSSALT